MEYSIYKFDFQTGVHFGTGMLNSSTYTFQADQLFSALYIEAIKMGESERFYEMTKTGRLLFSDAFPYINQQYMIPKPMVYVEPAERGKSEQKKAYKKLNFFPVECLTQFLTGTMKVSDDPLQNVGHFVQQTMAGVRKEEDTLPFRVGTFYFKERCGLYIIVAHHGSAEKELVETLLEALSYTGIGGKKSSGLGKFVLKHGKMPDDYIKCMGKKSDKNILLSVALPKEEELSMALEGASYQLEKRTGFVASTDYADEWRKKKELYVFSAGSCFEKSFTGDIYDVSDGGNHPVYRYAKALFMRV